MTDPHPPLYPRPRSRGPIEGMSRSLCAATRGLISATQKSRPH